MSGDARYSTHTDPACGCTMYQLTSYIMTDILYIRLMDFVDLIIKRAFYICAVIYDAITTSGHVLACVLTKRLDLQ